MGVAGNAATLDIGGDVHGAEALGDGRTIPHITCDTTRLRKLCVCAGHTAGNAQFSDGCVSGHVTKQPHGVAAAVDVQIPDHMAVAIESAIEAALADGLPLMATKVDIGGQLTVDSGLAAVDLRREPCQLRSGANEVSTVFGLLRLSHAAAVPDGQRRTSLDRDGLFSGKFAILHSDLGHRLRQARTADDGVIGDFFFAIVAVDSHGHHAGSVEILTFHILGLGGRRGDLDAGHGHFRSVTGLPHQNGEPVVDVGGVTLEAAAQNDVQVLQLGFGLANDGAIRQFAAADDGCADSIDVVRLEGAGVILAVFAGEARATRSLYTVVDGADGAAGEARGLRCDNTGAVAVGHDTVGDTGQAAGCPLLPLCGHAADVIAVGHRAAPAEIDIVENAYQTAGRSKCKGFIILVHLPADSGDLLLLEQDGAGVIAPLDRAHVESADQAANSKGLGRQAAGIGAVLNGHIRPACIAHQAADTRAFLRRQDASRDLKADIHVADHIAQGHVGGGIVGLAVADHTACMDAG